MVAKTKTLNVDPEAINADINGYKQLLNQTDYQALKYAEGQFSEEEYAEIKEYRQSLRDKINELEAQLDE